MKDVSAYLDLGWRLLPLNGKIPLLPDWPSKASSDPAQIAAWNAQFPDCNWGVVTGELFWVLDVDPRNGGSESLAKLNGTIAPTATVQTGSGGLHLYYAGSVPSTKLDKIGFPGLDIKGIGGQVVLPGSIHPDTGVEYDWTSDCEITSPTPALLALIQQARGHVVQRDSEQTARGFFPPASEAVLEAARDALRRHGPAIQGKGGSEHTFHASAKILHDFALTEAEAWPILCDWNETCVPPWPLEGNDSLRTRFNSGSRNGQRAYGCLRTMDSVQQVRKLIADWNGQDPIELIERARAVATDDPAKRAVIELDLAAATGIARNKLGLPKLIKIAEPLPSGIGPDFDRAQSGAPLDNLNNVVKALEWAQLDVHFDEFYGKVLKSDGTEWNDADTDALNVHLQDKIGLKKIGQRLVDQGVNAYAQSRKRNSVRDVFLALEWDGTERIQDLFVRGFGAERSEYTEAVARVFLCQIAARVLQPGCQADYMVILEGEQGIKKSTACRVLVGERLFASVKHGPTDRDFFQCLAGKLMLEWAELDSFGRSETSAVKSAVTERVDRYRQSYGRRAQDFARVAVFIGTTNGEHYLKDDTGNRRFLPIRCGVIDTDWIAANRSQLVAEAIAMVRGGSDWWALPGEATRAVQESRFQADPWEEILAKHFDENPDFQETRLSDLLRSPPLMVLEDKQNRSTQLRAASILRRLGWKRGHTRSGKVWVRG